MTPAEIVDEVYLILKASPLMAAVTGGLFKNNERPLSSTKEDIVVSCLGTPNSQLQRSLVNVNIYVPDMQKSAAYYQNHARVTELSKIAWDALKAYNAPGLSFFIQQQGVIRAEDIKQNFINNRVEIYTKNI